MSRDNPDQRSAPGRADAVLLACGVIYALVYAAANDLVAAGLYAGYSRLSQAISELSAAGAPTQGFLAAMSPVFSALLVAFGIGVWRSAGDGRALRVAAALFVAHGLTTFLWLLAPMSQRERIAAGGATSQDTMHIVLTALTVSLIVGQFAFGAAARGRRFRVYSLLTAVAVIGFGVLTGVQSAKLTAGGATPWLGLYERLSVGAWLLWITVLALALLRERVSLRFSTLAPQHAA